jgi:hypothetical protein
MSPSIRERGPRDRGLDTSPAKTTGESFTEQEVDHERRISGILEGIGDDLIVPGAIREVDRVRSAAVAILDADLPLPKEEALLARLLDVAKRCEIPALAAGAIIEELRVPELRPVATRTEATAARQLRRAGYGRCPACHREVLVERTLDRLEAGEREWITAEVRLAERGERVREAS